MNATLVTRTIFAAAVLLSAHAATAQTTITAWNFTNNSIGTSTSPITSTGSGTASTLGMINSYTGGSAANTSDISDIELGVAGSQDWRVRGSGNGWNSAAAEYTQGVQFSESTVGYSNINFTYDWNTTTKGIRDLQEQYTVDGINWINVNPLQVSNTTQTYMTGIDINFAALGITNVNNDANFGVRLVSAYDPTFGAGTSYTQAGTPTSVMSNTNGNWRFDNISVSGSIISAVPEPGSYAMMLAGLSLLAFMKRRKQ
jgi:hypothetical protein